MDNNDINMLRHIARALIVLIKDRQIVQFITEQTVTASKREQLSNTLSRTMQRNIPHIHKMIRVMVILLEDDVIAVPLITHAEHAIQQLMTALSSGDATLEMIEEHLKAALSNIKQILSTSTPNQEGS